MNHIAHALLSFGDEDLLLGNFIGDFVKGKDWQQYAEGVQRGIMLHRYIDDFTDNHPMSDRSVARVRPYARRFAAPVTDVLYDHLLLRHWGDYSEQPFDAFVDEAYAGLQKRAGEMPARLRERFPMMLADDFFRRYRTPEGMRQVMNRFSKRLPIVIEVAPLMDCFFAEIAAFSADFNAFYPELRAFAREFIDKG